ncbi:MAG: hypothetical protein JWR07_861 [Nevskia sp.]|nr:hypothetical protein [Nevskia sp.]
MFRTSKILTFCALAMTLALQSAEAAPDAPTAMPVPMPLSTSLAGAWSLVRVDNVYPDGHRVELYGPNPQGLWLIDAQGNYMMQMVRAQRGRFAANDKSQGTAEEYRAAAMDSNAHFGRVSVDGTTLHTHIEHASFPNWDGKDGTSAYSLKGDELSYTVAKPSSGAGDGAHGEVVWRRVR